MDKDQFIYWLKGFTQAIEKEGPTSAQWETIVSELDTIKDCTDFGSSIDDNLNRDSTYSEKFNTYSDASTTLIK